jgi:hypothetical protein
MDLCPFSYITAYIQPPEGSWITILSALLTPIIAILSLLIAANQWITAKRKLKLDLYEKRLVVYAATRHAIGEIVTSGQTNPQIEVMFLQGIAGSKWLFDKKMVAYLNDDLWKEIINVGTIQEMTEGMPPGEELSKWIEKRSKAKNTMNKHLQLIDDRFYPFLNLRH